MNHPPPSSGFGRFVTELRRRQVVRAGLAYGAVGFVLLQMAEISLPAFLPGPRADAALRVLVVAFLLLFPVVVVMAWVYEITPHGFRAMSDVDAEAGRPPMARVLPRLAFLAFTVVIAGGTGLWWYRTDTAAVESSGTVGRGRVTPFVSASTTDASGPIRSMAVLPLQDYSPDGDQEAYFAAGLHEALISQLSQVGTFRVISRTSVDGYARGGKSMPQIGAELGVDAVLEGSVLRADGRVRITAQLIHAASDTHLWASDYERDLEDVITLQREVALAIADEVGARVGGPEEAPVLEVDGGAPDVLAGASSGSDPEGVDEEALPVTPTSPASARVQDAAFRGRFALTGASVEEGQREAESHFLEALAMDSTFVPALTGLASAHLIRALEGPGESAFTELREARDLALQAVRRDPGSLEAREVLASVDEAFVEAGSRLSESGDALMAPGMRIVHVAVDSMTLVDEGDTTRLARPELPFGSTTEIGRFIQTAMAGRTERNALPSEEFRAIRRLEAAGRQKTALARALDALERYPEEMLLWDAAERLSVSTGDWNGVLRLREDRLEADVSSPGPGVGVLSRRLEEDGVAGYWAWKLEELDARESAGMRVSPVDRAAAYAALADVDRALSLLNEAREARDPRLTSLRSDPVWDPLRPDPRFQLLLRSLSRD